MTMVICRNKEEVEQKCLNVVIRENRLAFKRYEGSKFLGSILIPTELYPVISEDIEIFTAYNTDVIAYGMYADIINSCMYEVGKCYTNTERLAKAFAEHGITTFKTYAGWLFLGKSDIPVYHCWGVLDGRHIIDLADDFEYMIWCTEHMFDGLTTEECREKYVEYMKKSFKEPNSIRCSPLGKASRHTFYVGCACDPIEGAKLYDDLLKKYPNHESFISTDSRGATKLQQQLLAHNLGKI